MKSETVIKTARTQSGTSGPGAGETASRGTNAEIGATTKGSTTKANETTSTTLPRKPIPRAFLDKLGEMHTAEKELALALPLIVAAAKSDDLKALLQLHLEETKGHAKALEDIARSLGEELPAKSCPQVTALIVKGTKVIAKRLVTSDQDAELIGVGREIERFEIDSYQPLSAIAEQSDFTHERALLESILSQERLAHELLGALGEGKGPLNKLIEEASLKRAGATTAD